MEPRWDAREWAKRPDLAFVGGTADFDIWVEQRDACGGDHTGIRLCAGEGNEWDLLWNTSEDNLRLYYGDLVLTAEQLRDVQNYIKLFAPWAEHLLKLGIPTDV